MPGNLRPTRPEPAMRPIQLVATVPAGPDGLPDVCQGCDARLGADVVALASGRFHPECAPVGPADRASNNPPKHPWGYTDAEVAEYEAREAGRYE